MVTVLHATHFESLALSERLQSDAETWSQHGQLMKHGQSVHGDTRPCQYDPERKHDEKRWRHGYERQPPDEEYEGLDDGGHPSAHGRSREQHQKHADGGQGMVSSGVENV